MASVDMNHDGAVDLVTGTKTGVHSGTVELWLNESRSGDFVLADKAEADDVVLSLALGRIDTDVANSPDIVAGTAARSLQVWFCDSEATDPTQIIPANESWADANVGGVVNAVAIARVGASRDHPEYDPLLDIIAGTATSSTSGEVVVYMNPYAWTMNPP
jgi:hypothetical protein